MGKGRISNCDVIINNLFDLTNGTYKTPKVGTLMAANSPQNRKLRDTLKPVRDEDGSLSRNNLGQPQVKVQYQTQKTRKILTDPSCEGTTPDVPSEISFTLTKYAQLEPLTIRGTDFNRLCNEALDNLSLGPGNKILGIKKNIKKTKWIGWLNEAMGQYINSLLEYINQQQAQALLAGVGVNAKYGNATAQPIYLFDSNGEGQKPFLWDELHDVERENDMCGTPIIIGGRNIDKYFYRSGIACCSDIGIDYAAVGTKLPAEFYYDKVIEDTFGVNQFALAYPDTFAFLSYPRYEYLATANGNDVEHGNSQFGVFSISELSCSAGDRLFDIDLKIRLIDCDPNFGNEPYWVIIPSISYDMFTIPTGLKYDSGPLQNVNGIFRYIGINQ